jgi:hypothetical protein
MKQLNFNKWQIIFTLIFSQTAFSLYSQNVHIGYDAAGNRIFLYNDSERAMSTGGQEIKFHIPPFLKTPPMDSIFAVNPNPSSDQIVLSSKIKSEEGIKYNIALYDGMGKLIQQYQNVEIPFTADISTYPVGLYFLKVSDKNKLQTLKIMKK